MKEILGRMLANKRKSLKLTQEQMAKKVKVHRVTLAKIETGKMNTLTLGKIEALLRMNGLDWFDLAREFMNEEIRSQE